MSPQASWFTGTIPVNGSETHHWNNTNPNLAYFVGLNPQGASTLTPCQMEVTRSWYVQQPSGEGEFWFTVKNVGSLACSAEILLTWRSNIAGAWPTGGLDPGASVTKHWNNAIAPNSYVAGVSPVGATATTACQFEVVREWYAQQPSGEREFWWTIKNVGSIACSANVLLGYSSSTKVTETPVLAAGASISRSWNNANPLNGAYLVGLSPDGATATNSCQFEVTRIWYRQKINPPAERELVYTVKNAGAISCSADVLLVSIAA